jgi:hypothetical protein
MIITFCFVIFISMLKEAYEDYFRAQQDKEINMATVSTYSTEKATWR